MKPHGLRCGEREREREARIKESSRANQEVIVVYGAYGTVICPKTFDTNRLQSDSWKLIAYTP